MNRTLIVCLFLIAVTALSQVPRASVPAGALLWNVYLESPGLYHIFGKLPPGRVAVLKSDADVTITRIQAESRSGPVRQRFTGGGYAQIEPCVVKPTLLITNGKTQYTLSFPDPVVMGVPPFNGDSGSSADSGPINLPFRQGTSIELYAVPGDTQIGNPDVGGYSSCYLLAVNVAIQYRTH